MPPFPPSYTCILYSLLIHSLQQSLSAFLVSLVTLCYILTSEDSKLATTDEQEHMASVFLGLGYCTQNHLFQVSSFTYKWICSLRRSEISEIYLGLSPRQRTAGNWWLWREGELALPKAKPPNWLSNTNWSTPKSYTHTQWNGLRRLYLYFCAFLYIHTYM